MDQKLIDNLKNHLNQYHLHICHNLLKIQITRESLFSLFDDISHLIHKARKNKQDKPVHNLKRRLPSSEISIKVVFD